MNDVPGAIGRSLHELADQGRPVNLGRAALAGARRRRRTRVGVGAAAVAGAGALGLVLPIGLAGGASTEQTAPAAGADQVVITYYLGGDPLAGYALDPLTGEYHRDAQPPSSPDLRQTVDDGGNFVVDLTDRSQHRIAWPQPTRNVWWSPDGTHLASAVGRPDDQGPVDTVTAVQVADLAADTGWEIPLDLSPHHAGTDVFWLGSDRLAVPVADQRQTVEVPVRYEWTTGNSTAAEGGGHFSLVTEVQVYDLDGTLAERFPVDQSDYARSNDPGQLWQVSNVAGDGTVLLTRHPTETTMELATAGAGGLQHRATLTLPRAPEDHYWRPPVAVLALADDRLLVQAELHQVPWDGAPSHLYVSAEHHVIDLVTGQSRTADVPTLPDQGRPWVYADAAALPPAAAHRAFTP